MSLIEIKDLTKGYGNGRGIFNINLNIEKGQTFGFVGTNGAGKTTVIRHLMGFLKQQSGSAEIDGRDCWNDSALIKKSIGYVPGEIAFPDAPTGTEFLKRQADLIGLKDMSYSEEIIKILQLDPTANLKRMSKGMKQKTAIVAAFMADPEILILDEPTTGLDPLMRAGFINLLNQEREKGKTIFMSSHMFEEVEETCDKVALIKDGFIIAVKSTLEIKHNEDKVYKVEFLNKDDYVKFVSIKDEKGSGFDFSETNEGKNQVIINIHDREINKLTKELKNYKVKYITEIKYSLEKYFKSLY